MTTEINFAKVVKLAKAGKSQPEAARELGVTPGQLNMLTWGKALVEAGKLQKAPNTEASIKKLRQGGARFEYIAAQTGASVAKVKEIAGDIAIARGRKAENGGASSKRSTTSKTSTAKSSTAKRSTAKSATSGRRSGGAKSKTAAAPAGRKRTLAERRGAGNPS